MKKRKINIKISNRLSYTLITIGILIVLGVGVYAVAGVSHSVDELPSIPWSKLVDIPEGVYDVCPEGYDLMEGEYRTSCIKDFPEVSCSYYLDLGYGILDYNAYAKRVNGVLQTRVTMSNSLIDNCDSGWVEGVTATCTATSGSNYVAGEARFDGDIIWGDFDAMWAGSLGTNTCTQFLGN